MFYKLVNKIGNGRIESADKARRPAAAPAGLLKGRGIATPEFYNAKR